MPSALVILAEGAEEMEVVIPTDVLRRAEVDVTVAGLDGSDPVVCSRKVVISPDVSLADVLDQEYDAIILPGGLGGSQKMAESAEVASLVHEQGKSGRIVAAICAGPQVFAKNGLFKEKRVTSHPGIKDMLCAAGYRYMEENVCVDGNVITSRGPGTAFDFALAIVAALQGDEVRDAIKKPMLL